jgi:hypothetical protein
MRALRIIAFLYFATAGIAAAHGADLPDGNAPRNVFTHNVPYGHRAGPIIIYDFQPGVVVRAYWLPPWRHRHYFPFGAEKVAADTDDGPPQPAETFERSWSTCDVCSRELPPLRARDEAAPADEQPAPGPAPKK